MEEAPEYGKGSSRSAHAKGKELINPSGVVVGHFQSHFNQQSGSQGIKLTTCLHILPWLIMCAAVPPFPHMSLWHGT